MASFFRTYRITKDGRRIDGAFAMAFIHNMQYHLTHISIFQDGMIDCWGLVDFEDFKQKVRSGWVVTQPPEGAVVSVSFLAHFNARDARFHIEPEEFIKEVADEIEALNGRPTTSDRCRDAWRCFEKDPSDENRDRLEEAWLSIPKHNRRYVLGDQDRKDGAIRRVLNRINE